MLEICGQLKMIELRSMKEHTTTSQMKSQDQLQKRLQKFVEEQMKMIL